MFVSKVLSVISLLHVTLTINAINITKEAKTITRENCKIIKNDNNGAPIMYAAADVILIGKTGAMGKSYGDGNQNFDISVTPHCLLKGNTDKSEITVRKLGPGKCGPVNVEKNDPVPYLFFLYKTSDSSVYDIVNLGAKKLPTSGLIWTPAFPFFCKMKNKKVCGSSCDLQCSKVNPLPAGGCIEYEQNVIDAYKALAEEKKKAEKAIPPTPKKAPMVTPTPKSAITAKPSAEKPKKPMETKETKAKEEKADESKEKPKMSGGTTVNYTAVDSNATVAKNVKDPENSCVTFSSGSVLIVVLMCATVISLN